VSEREVVVVGTSHRRAPLALRERLRLDAHAARGLALALRTRGDEAVVLSTCNRTELYLVCAHPADAVTRAEDALVRLGGSPVRSTLFRRRGEGAAEHLFEVAGGLDSLVPGESQILGQVRDAYRLARAAGTAGPLLSRLFDQAVRTGKRVRSETILGRDVSIPSVALQLAERDLGYLTQRRVVVVGTGAMAELVLAKLLFRDLSEIVLVGRTQARTAKLAARFGARPASLDALPRELLQADLVITATSAPGVVVRATDVANALARRGNRQLVLLDLAVPRDVDPRAAAVEGCRIHDVDDLEPAVRRGQSVQSVELVRARAIVAEEVEAFREHRRALEVAPAIASLHRRAEEIRAGELARANGRLASLSPEQREAVDVLTGQIVRKLLHTPSVRLKEADGLAYAAALEHLFALEREAA
jgi:glutamyl-tRNA reductase